MSAERALGPVRVVRERSADVVIWLSLTGLAAVLVGLSMDSSASGLLSPLRYLAHQTHMVTAFTTPPWVSTSIAALVAAIGLALHRHLLGDRVRWWTLQVTTAALAAAWSAALADTVGVTTIELPSGPPLAHSLARLMDSLDVGVRLVVVGAVTAAAVLLLNAAVQSLCGQQQARRMACVIALSPSAAWYAEGATAWVLLMTTATLALAAMSSERGRGSLWTSGLGSLAGAMLALAVLVSYPAAATGIGVLCIYFLRRRPMTIVVSGLVMSLVLLLVWLSGSSWSAGFDATVKTDEVGGLGPRLAAIVIGVLVVAALGGPALVASWRKVRSTPAWPILLMASLAVLGVLLLWLRDGSWLSALAPWLPLMSIAAVAPVRPAGVPAGPPVHLLAVSAIWGIGLSILAAG